LSAFLSPHHPFARICVSTNASQWIQKQADNFLSYIDFKLNGLNEIVCNKFSTFLNDSVKNAKKHINS
jgi:hypothetical protein